MGIKNKKIPDCPTCKDSDSVIPMVYGFPGGKLLEQAAKGKIFFGGCIIPAVRPTHHCSDCGNEWKEE